MACLNTGMTHFPLSVCIRVGPWFKSAGECADRRMDMARQPWGQPQRCAVEGITFAALKLPECSRT